MASIFGIVLLKDKFPQFYDNLNKLSTGRFRIYEIGINRLKNPLILIFGEGLGSAHLTLVEHGSYNYYYHSWFLHVLVSGGLISLGLTFWIQKKVFTVVKEHKSKFFYFVAIAVVIYFAHNIIDIGYDYQFLGMYFYFLIAMIENNKKIDLEGGLNINEKDIITN